MILTCPECGARFKVPANALGAEGRSVRCTKCRHVWFQMAQIPNPNFGKAPPLPKALQPKPPRQARSRKGAGKFFWLSFLLLLLGGFGAALVVREQLVAAWPPSARLFDSVGLPVPAPGQFLSIEDFQAILNESESGYRLDLDITISNPELVRILDLPPLRADLLIDRKITGSYCFEIGPKNLHPGDNIVFSRSLSGLNNQPYEVELRFTRALNDCPVAP